MIVTSKHATLAKGSTVYGIFAWGCVDEIGTLVVMPLNLTRRRAISDGRRWGAPIRGVTKAEAPGLLPSTGGAATNNPRELSRARLPDRLVAYQYIYRQMRLQRHNNRVGGRRLEVGGWELRSGHGGAPMSRKRDWWRGHTIVRWRTSVAVDD